MRRATTFEIVLATVIALALLLMLGLNLSGYHENEWQKRQRTRLYAKPECCYQVADTLRRTGMARSNASDDAAGDGLLEASRYAEDLARQYEQMAARQP